MSQNFFEEVDLGGTMIAFEVDGVGLLELFEPVILKVDILGLLKLLAPAALITVSACLDETVDGNFSL